jgi:hypothetical protein
MWKKIIEHRAAEKLKEARQEENQRILMQSCARALENKMLRMLIMTGNDETGYYRGYMFHRPRGCHLPVQVQERDCVPATPKKVYPRDSGILSARASFCARHHRGDLKEGNTNLLR